ncbi:SDR family NAD(P)-dependent oxidoreductase [Williamsia muralis]|uniref:SDR family NAD(P)-dependent oxidoreductase n=1 Tax=Williamsia marianensis TaxID=85044 RepID=UPI003F13DA2D
MDLSNKVVVIIGGGNGIGAAGAVQLAAQGCKVVIGDISESSALQCAEMIRRRGGQAVGIKCDASSEDDLGAAHRAALESFGTVDMVWCHAGRPMAGILEHIPTSQWLSLLEFNCLSPVRAFAEFAPAMIARSAGHLVVTSSSLGLFPEQVPMAAPYVMSKAALVGYSRALREYLRPAGVGVTLLCPDATATSHASNISLIGMDTDTKALDIDTSTMDSPESVAAALVDGLERDLFLVSSTLEVEARLHADVDHLTGRQTADETGGSSIVVTAELVVDGDKHDQLVQALRELTEQTVREEGNVRYKWTCGLDSPGVFTLFEEWRSAEAAAAHGESAHGRAFLEFLRGVGKSSITATRLDVRSSEPMAPPR